MLHLNAASVAARVSGDFNMASIVTTPLCSIRKSEGVIIMICRVGATVHIISDLGSGA